MRLISFVRGESASWGLVRGDTVVDMRRLGFPDTVLAFIQAGPPAWTAGRSLEDVPSEALLPLDSVTVQAPIPRPAKNIVCLGENYRAHAAESGHAPPASPIYFTKAPTAVSAPNAGIVLDPDLTGKLDYEGELGVVMGLPGRRVSADEALGHVFGYTIVNDVSARDVQHGRPERQWFLGKSFDGSCPMGPCILTTDEIPDPHALTLTVRVNGEVRQSESTGAMVFSVAEIVADLSRYLTLDPGDIISTGTPSGVGAALTPPRYLAVGDVVEIEVERLGVLRNVVVPPANEDGRA